MDNLFYKVFEEKYRGSRELIKNRLRVYIDLIGPLKDIYTEPNAIDLGCGRGEWLELISEHGFKAHGVDIDEGMLEDCHKHNLSFTKQDALEYLKNLPDESQTLITAFHLAEHLSNEVLLSLTSEAKRVLKPCGLLIMETPNTENIFVGVNNFYLDPTHIRPIPIGLLSFIAEYTGFLKTKVLRLQENKELLSNENIEFMDIINGVSPDYAVLAQKDGPQENLVLFEEAFSKNYGLSLVDLGEAYEKSKVETINKLYIALESQGQQIESQGQQIESQGQQIESQGQQIESQGQQLESQSQQLESQSQQMLHLRRVIQLVKLIKWLIKLPIRLVRWVVRKIKNLIRQILLNVVVLFTRTPYLKYYAKILLRKAPRLENKIYKKMASINVALPSPNCREDNIDMYLKEVAQYQTQNSKATSLLEIFRAANDNQFAGNDTALLTSRIKEARNKEKSFKQ